MTYSFVVGIWMHPTFHSLGSRTTGQMARTNIKAICVHNNQNVSRAITHIMGLLALITSSNLCNWFSLSWAQTRSRIFCIIRLIAIFFPELYVGERLSTRWPLLTLKSFCVWLRDNEPLAYKLGMSYESLSESCSADAGKLVAVITSSFQVIREEGKASAFTVDDQWASIVHVSLPFKLSQYRSHILDDEEILEKPTHLKQAFDKTYWLWILIIVFDIIVQGLRSADMGNARRDFISMFHCLW